MKKYLLITLALFTSIAMAAINIDVDSFKSPDQSKTWSLPAATDTLVGRSSTDTLTNKTIDGASNTITGVTASSIPNLTGDVTSVNTVTTIPPSTVTNAMLAGSIAYGKLSLSNSILNADINSSAAIAYSKLASIPTGSILLGNAGVPTATALSGGATVGATGVVTLGNSAVITQLLTGYTAGAGTVSSADTILQGLQKIDGNDQLKIPKSVVAAKGDLIGATASGTPTNIQVGSDFQSLIADSTNAKGVSYATINSSLGAVVQLTAKENLNTWITGNAATIVPGTSTGTFAGTFAKETSSPIYNSASYKYTQAAGSLNDYMCSPAISIPVGLRGNTAYLSFPMNYNGSSGDLQTSVWDVTGTAAPLPFGNVPDITNNLTTQTNIYSVGVQPATTSVRICYQVKAVNSAKIFNYADVQLSSSLYSTVSLNSLSGWTPWTPTFGAGISAPTNVSFKYRQNGQNLEGIGFFTIGGVAASIPSFTLPTGLNIDTSIITQNNTTSNPGQLVGSASVAVANGLSNILTATGTSTSTMYMGFNYDSAASKLTPASAANAVWVNGNNVSLYFSVPISGWSAYSTALASPLQQVSSDTMALTFKSTAISSTDPVGTFNTYLKASNVAGLSGTINTSAPTQTIADMNLNGLRIYAAAYASASTANLPSRFDIKIGTGLSAYQVDAFTNTGKTTPVGYDSNNNQSGAFYGVRRIYDPTTGILTIDAATFTSNSTSQYIGIDVTGNQQSSAYFTFKSSTTPTIATIKDAAICTGAECIDNFSFQVSATGVVSNESYDVINGNCAITDTSLFTCSYNSGIVTQAMNCTAAPFVNNGDTAFGYPATTTSSAIGVRTGYSAGGASALTKAAYAFNVSCQKNIYDSRPKQFKVTQGMAPIAVIKYDTPSTRQTLSGSNTVIPLTSLVDPFGIVSLSSNIFTLQPGTYQISFAGYFTALAASVASSGGLYYSATNSIAVKGTPGNGPSAGNYSANTGAGILTVATATTFDFRARLTSGSNGAYGDNYASPDDEKLVITITKMK